MLINPLARGAVAQTQAYARQQTATGNALPLPPATGGNTDTVTISDSALAMAATANRREHVQADMQAASGLAYTRDTLKTVSEETENGTKLTRESDGTEVTPGHQAAFEKMASRVQTVRANIFETEKAKGTPPAQIEGILNNFMSNLPERYKLDINWQDA